MSKTPTPDPQPDLDPEQDDAPTQFKVTYNGATETYELVMSGITFGEARAIEKVSGQTFAKIMANPELRAEIGVLQALIWVSMKRKHPTLTFSELDDVAIDAIEWPEDPAGAQGDADDATTGPTQGAAETTGAA